MPEQGSVPSAAAGSNRTDLVLPFGREAPSIARRFVAEVFEGRVDAEALDDVRILASELVTNSVVHGRPIDGATLRLCLEWTPASVRLTVRDGGEPFRWSPSTAPRDAGGRGLHIVHVLASRWGVAADDGKAVWAELDLPSSGHHAAA